MFSPYGQRPLIRDLSKSPAPLRELARLEGFLRELAGLAINPSRSTATSPIFASRIRQSRPGNVDNVARRLRDLLRSEIFTGAFENGLLPSES